jgi:hypothetical protein
MDGASWYRIAGPGIFYHILQGEKTAGSTGLNDAIFFSADIGTTSLKAIAYDPNGNALFSAVIEYPMHHPYRVIASRILLKCMKRYLQE